MWQSNGWESLVSEKNPKRKEKKGKFTKNLKELDEISQLLWATEFKIKKKNQRERLCAWKERMMNWQRHSDVLRACRIPIICLPTESVLAWHRGSVSDLVYREVGLFQSFLVLFSHLSVRNSVVSAVLTLSLWRDDSDGTVRIFHLLHVGTCTVFKTWSNCRGPDIPTTIS